MRTQKAPVRDRGVIPQICSQPRLSLPPELADFCLCQRLSLCLLQDKRLIQATERKKEKVIRQELKAGCEQDASNLLRSSPRWTGLLTQRKRGPGSSQPGAGDHLEREEERKVSRPWTKARAATRARVIWGRGKKPVCEPRRSRSPLPGLGRWSQSPRSASALFHWNSRCTPGDRSGGAHLDRGDMKEWQEVQDQDRDTEATAEAEEIAERT